MPELSPSLRRNLAIGIAAGAALLTVIILIWHFSSGTTAVASIPAVLKCRDCGHEIHMSAAEVSDKATRGSEHPDPPGVPCPNCGKTEGVSATVCKRDGTVFYTRMPKAEGSFVMVDGKCPKCGWDPIAEQQEELRRKLGR